MHGSGKNKSHGKKSQGETGCPHGAFVCPLSRVVAGSAVRIRQIDASPEVARRLREVGFCEDQRVTLLSRQENLICLVCNARLGISSRLAESILVELLPSLSSED